MVRLRVSYSDMHQALKLMNSKGEVLMIEIKGKHIPRRIKMFLENSMIQNE